MSRYINAELAKETIRKWFNTNTKAKAPMPRICKKAMTVAIGAVDLTPTADVVEVRHGEWIDKHCSLCGETQPYTARGNAFATTFYQVRTKFCPNCGAKMDGQRRTDDEG